MILNEIANKEKKNVRIKKLQNYYAGKQAILQRVYEDKTKPNNKIVINYCQKIADFFTSYLVGVPLEYENITSKVKKVLSYNDADEVTQNSVLNMNICGVGYELLYVNEIGHIKIKSIDPKEIIMIYDDTLEEKLVKAIRYYPNIDQNGDLKNYHVDVYDTENITQYIADSSLTTLTPVEKPQKHNFNHVPIIEYKNNDLKQGSFEQIISLQDAYNKLCSDEINDFESFVDAYLMLEGMDGTDNNDIDQMKQNRVLLVPQGGKASWLIKNVNGEHNKDLKEKIEQQIHEIGCLPKLEEKFGTSSGVAIRYKLIPTEIKAAEQERNVYKALQLRLMLLYDVMNKTKNSRYIDVKIKFIRNFIVNEEKAMMMDKLREDALTLDSDELALLYLQKQYGFSEEEAKRIVKNEGFSSSDKQELFDE